MRDLGNTLRKATLADVERLLEIEAHFDSDWIFREEFEAAIKDPDIDLIVAVDKEIVMGYGLLKPSSKPQTAWLYSLISLNHTGGLILTSLELIAKTRKYRFIRLEVKYKNPKAIEFYERMGYRCIDFVKHFYDDGRPAFRFIKEIL